MFKGIILIVDKFDNYGELIKSLVKNDKFKLIHSFSSDNFYSQQMGFAYLGEYRIDEISNEEIFFKINNNISAFCIFRKRLYDILASQYIPFFIIPREYIINDIQKNDFHMKLDQFMKIFLYENKANIRGIENFTNYNISCDNEIKNIYNLILMLWEHQNSTGVLTKKMIEKMVLCGMLLKNASISQISNASYDLLLGDEYYYKGRVKKLSDEIPFISIEPYDYIIASTKESMAFPRDIVARFDLVVNLFFQGIILSNSTQIDPGFNGKLFCLLFNTSNKTVYLKREDPLTTIEFNKLCEPTTTYAGKYADEECMEKYLPPNILQGALNELKKEVEGLKKESSEMQKLYLSVLTILLAIISILAATK